MPKKVIKKHTTHNENKNHIHIHIGDKKRKNKRGKRQGKGEGGSGGAISVQSMAHPPNIVIPHYNRPQYLDSSTQNERENPRHHASSFHIPNIRHLT